MRRAGSLSGERRGASNEADPFAACSAEPGTEFLSEALETWFSTTPSRAEMVRDCGHRFFEIAAVAVSGCIVSCERAFTVWAGRFGPSTDEQSACYQLALLDLNEPTFAVEWEVDRLFALYLREARIRLPDEWTLLVYYAVAIARRLAEGDFDAIEGARILSRIDIAIAQVHPACRRKEKPPHLGVERFGLLANGIMPDTFEPLGVCHRVIEQARVEAAAFVARNAELANVSDDPNDWPTNWR